MLEVSQVTSLDSRGGRLALTIRCEGLQSSIKMACGCKHGKSYSHFCKPQEECTNATLLLKVITLQLRLSTPEGLPYS